MLWLSELFFQPTFYCRNLCKNCYVKNHSFLAGKQVSWKEQVKVFKQFCLGKDCWAEQISISVDELSSNPKEEEHQLAFLSGVIETLDILSERKDSQLPEVHLTMNSTDTLSEYAATIPDNCWNFFDTISFSNLEPKDIDILCGLRDQGIQTNYNILVGKTNVDDLGGLLMCLDSVYLIMPKNISPPMTVGDYLAYYENYTKRFGCKKFILDVCARDIEYRKLMDYACCANISKFTIWPDGSVSGCPYARTSNTPAAKKAKDIITNIWTAKKCSDFSNCPLVR